MNAPLALERGAAEPVLLFVAYPAWFLGLHDVPPKATVLLALSPHIHLHLLNNLNAILSHMGSAAEPREGGALMARGRAETPPPPLEYLSPEELRLPISPDQLPHNPNPPSSSAAALGASNLVSGAAFLQGPQGPKGPTGRS